MDFTPSLSYPRVIIITKIFLDSGNSLICLQDTRSEYGLGMFDFLIFLSSKIFVGSGYQPDLNGWVPPGPLYAPPMSPDFGGNNIPPSPDSGDVVDNEELDQYSTPPPVSPGGRSEEEDTEEPDASEEAQLYNVILVKDEETKYSFLYTRVFCL